MADRDAGPWRSRASAAADAPRTFADVLDAWPPARRRAELAMAPAEIRAIVMTLLTAERLRGARPSRLPGSARSAAKQRRVRRYYRQRVLLVAQRCLRGVRRADVDATDLERRGIERTEVGQRRERLGARDSLSM
jgi:hypothetical protein